MDPESPLLTAKISREWRKRMVLIILFVTAGGLWFLYDAAIGYPRSNERFEAHAALEQQLGADDKVQLEEAWKALTNEKGWGGGKPPKKLFSSQDITTQWVIGGFTVLGGMAFAVFLVTQLPKIVQSDGTRITGPDGRTKVPILSIRSIDKRKWKDQGIALLRYQTHEGLKKFVLDDYKFIGVDKILADAESRLKTEREKKDLPS